jgi:hypothetical protein
MSGIQGIFQVPFWGSFGQRRKCNTRRLQGHLRWAKRRSGSHSNPVTRPQKPRNSTGHQGKQTGTRVCKERWVRILTRNSGRAILRVKKCVMCAEMTRKGSGSRCIACRGAEYGLKTCTKQCNSAVVQRAGLKWGVHLGQGDQLNRQQHAYGPRIRR